jgi:hypothetical protein
MTRSFEQMDRHKQDRFVYDILQLRKNHSNIVTVKAKNNVKVLFMQLVRPRYHQAGEPIDEEKMGLRFMTRQFHSLNKAECERGIQENGCVFVYI